MLVIAGPGSGKTRALAARILHLTSVQNVAPSTLLLLTHTNKVRPRNLLLGGPRNLLLGWTS